ncbi:hypothetical protein GCM10023340_22790 [Nocardioides marinquilinus]|uniref:MarR family transcriptional regulator n=1 Tax=Nocardioides marinquilinus TaxID=1210400 RepID=A0ABP9PLK5_9ACTN
MDATDARRLHDLVEPIGMVAYAAEEPNAAMAGIGLTRTYWDGYFAARAAPLGPVPAEVVDALFYSFAPGEVARHVPSVWDVVTPAAARAAHERGCVAGLRAGLGDLADAPSLARAADLLTTAAVSAPLEGRPMHAALRALPVPPSAPDGDPLHRLWHAAVLLREHRGDGHVAALMVCGVGRTESHVLHALSMGLAAHEFGRIHHLPRAQLDAVVDGLRTRGLVDDAGGFTEAGRTVKQRVETLTDELAVAPYLALDDADRAELEALLAPVAARLREVWGL